MPRAYLHIQYSVCNGNCAQRSLQCYNNGDCKIGLACGRNNCKQIIEDFKEIIYDCCEKCKKYSYCKIPPFLSMNMGIVYGKYNKSSLL